MKLTASVAMALASLAAADIFDDSTEELKLDMDDVPRSCKTICNPIATLSKQCDVDLGLGKGKDEDLLHNQCVCTNNSFKVGQIAAECADCMHQHIKAKRSLSSHDDDDDIDSDDVKDIDRLVSGCGFSSAHYNPTMAAAAATITVDATAPSHKDQLTTTIKGTHNAAAPTAIPGYMYAGAAAAAAAAML
ncbi:Protein CAP22 [Beauveria bassiana]|uniref:Protein CAP22 n=1 Tax=Beauveria bassiana (strain ARSEF 2860) TaxID=655819 RepID=J4KQH0_BEAB2|nr:uncharacterized protein BBA_02224 [Beauveria bassiana ARSEF 2860]EJP69189.1 hypothetical protein BBA_02224 [Beauveria bassiana ARSEF 2860]KAF1738726.1 Protein CAP22 [Beauveria bassiana]KAH8720791.1 Protein CAP22 [Beauveria bassiana]